MGETLSALPVVERMRAADPELGFILSYSSPSVAEWGTPKPFQHGDYLPPDDPKILDAVLCALKPSAILFSRGDLWPNLLQVAALKGIPAILAGGSISPESLRLRQPVRNWLRRIYSRLDFVAAVSRFDAARFIQLGVPRSRIAVAGDPRHDHAIERPVQLKQIEPLARWAAGDPVIVAGSTHEADEGLVSQAFSLAAEQRGDLRLVVVPHEPGRSPAVSLACPGSLVWAGEPEIPRGAKAVVVARLGLLADLYSIAVAAHVGGGFGRKGVHSLIEPAVFGIPVSFGPNWRNSVEAIAMLREGGGVSLARPSAAGELARRWLAWLQYPEAAAEAGRRNRKALKKGAATICARAALGLIRSRALHTLRM